VVVGHITVLNDGAPVTAMCDVIFTDGDKHEKGSVPIVWNGWIFADVKTGPTYLSTVTCRLEGAMTGVATYKASDLQFDVLGDGKITYFGHVRIDLNHKPSGGGAVAEGASEAARREGDRAIQNAISHGGSPTAAALGAGAGAIAGAVLVEFGTNLVEHFRERGENAEGEVHSRLKEARNAYELRYGRPAGGLKIQISLAGGGPPATADPPTNAAGFELGKGAGAAEAQCTGAGLVWQKLDEERFSCSGAPRDLGAPMTATLTTCAGAICEVTLNASADAADWGTLAERFSRLSRNLEWLHGYERQRTVTPLDDCADEPKRCFDAGRARRSATWRWNWDSYDKQSVSLVVDGGPRDGSPSLRVVYRTAPAIKRKP
jgi:hypothetical protein